VWRDELERVELAEAGYRPGEVIDEGTASTLDAVFRTLTVGPFPQLAAADDPAVAVLADLGRLIA
jgi:hypothetical protein